MSEQLAPIAVLGGTGNLGYGLAKRWAAAGRDVIIGSRSAEKAEAAAAEIRATLKPRGGAAKVGSLRGADNLAASSEAGIVTLTVPFASQASTLEGIKAALAGKILIDTTVPLMPPKVMRVQLPKEGSAARIAQNIVGESVKVVSAFHNVAADLLRGDDELDCDVLVFGDNKDAREAVVALAELAGLRAFHSGSLDNSAAAEALTSVMIFLNKQYNGHAGIRITGVGKGGA
ncbi:MAG TPA: NADPH-dependent F420 reductase [Burkholderiales bacterium]|nr:NADPH-dependent F420 reductase [Burkholderiales bacterium]